MAIYLKVHINYLNNIHVDCYKLSNINYKFMMMFGYDDNLFKRTRNTTKLHQSKVVFNTKNSITQNRDAIKN